MREGGLVAGSRPHPAVNQNPTDSDKSEGGLDWMAENISITKLTEEPRWGFFDHTIMEFGYLESVHFKRWQKNG